MNSRFSIFLLVQTLFVFTLLSCNSEYSAGKKKGYFKIDFPEKKYKQFNQPGYPYTFEYPEYARVIKDTTFFDDKAGDWWINIDFPRFDGRIYVSYKPINAENVFDSLVRDGFKMAYKQNVDVSTGIEDSLIQTPNGVEGLYFSLKGNTATANQFFLTDSTRHFFRGALYFNAVPNEDSLGIVNEFLKKDLLHLINTLRWTTPVGVITNE
jgi:gliding motility-associated lipoprotein GldD